MTTDQLGVAFILEQHLGHRTYALNLQQAAASYEGIEPHWIPVAYEATEGWFEHVPVPAGVQSILRARREIREGLRSLSTDVHVFNTQVPAALAPRPARAVPYVVISDVTPMQYDAMARGYGHRADRPGLLRSFKHRWNRHVLAGACRVVAWSTWTRDSFVTDYGVPPERTAVIPPGVDLQQWEPLPKDDEHPVRILFVGGEFDRKGGPELLHAFRHLAPAQAELVLVTKSTVEVSEGIRVVDDLVPNDPRLVELFRTSDIFVLPSQAETFGIAAVEASAAGLPVIASAVGGLTDIVADGETGFAIPPGDRGALATRLRVLVEHPELRRQMGAAARQRAVERFDASTNAGRLFDLIRGCARS